MRDSITFLRRGAARELACASSPLLHASLHTPMPHTPSATLPGPTRADQEPHTPAPLRSSPRLDGRDEAPPYISGPVPACNAATAPAATDIIPNARVMSDM